MPGSPADVLTWSDEYAFGQPMAACTSPVGRSRCRTGKHTVMYIDGCSTVDNPTLLTSNGITQLALPWALGGYEYGGVINQIFHGWGGDVRIVNRPLPVREFMTSG